MIQRMSSMLFMISVLLFYVPKIFKIKKFYKFIKVHMVLGIISIVLMIIECIRHIGEAGAIKYLGFTLIMSGIGLTGYLLKKKRGNKIYRKCHLGLTIGFFVYLFISIKYL